MSIFIISSSILFISISLSSSPCAYSSSNIDSTLCAPVLSMVRVFDVVS